MTKHFITSYGRRIVLFSACFLFATLTFQSCKKKDLPFGNGTLNPDELLATGGQAFDISTYSVVEDSFPSDNQLNALLGTMHDPKMGLVKASFFTQFNYSSKIAHTAGTTFVIDSVVLSLRYNGYYGNLTPQTFEVYEMVDPIHVDSTYYKFSDFAVSSTNLVLPSSATQTPNPTDDMIVGTDSSANAQLRLQLDPTIGNTLLNEAINGSAFSSTTEFQTFFKGLKITTSSATPNAGDGAILYFNLGSADSKLTVFYHIPGDDTDYSFKVIIDSKCGDFNQVAVDNTGYPVAAVLADNSLGNTQFYAQAFQTRAKVDFNSISSIPKGSFIHAAVLELPVAFQTGTMYYPSVYLSAVIKNATNTGYYATTFDNTRKSYIFDLREYVQDIVNEETSNTGIYINPSYFTSTSERIVFNGVNTPYKMKPKLVIKYTTF